VKEAVDAWQRKRGGERRFSVRVQTLPVAVANCLSSIGQPAPAPKPLRTVASGEVRLIHRLVNSTRTGMKAVRADARLRRAEVPKYPDELDLVEALLSKWAGPPVAP
jgi:hypothetical protein